MSITTVKDLVTKSSQLESESEHMRATHEGIPDTFRRRVSDFVAEVEKKVSELHGEQNIRRLENIIQKWQKEMSLTGHEIYEGKQLSFVDDFRNFQVQIDGTIIAAARIGEKKYFTPMLPYVSFSSPINLAKAVADGDGKLWAPIGENKQSTQDLVTRLLQST